MDQLERLMMVANGNELAQSSSQTMQVPACSSAQRISRVRGQEPDHHQALIALLLMPGAE